MTTKKETNARSIRRRRSDGGRGNRADSDRVDFNDPTKSQAEAVADNLKSA